MRSLILQLHAVAARKRLLFVVPLVLIVAGCAGSLFAARRDAQHNYERSTAEYRVCLAHSPPQACEGKWLAMEADERAYNTFTASMGGKVDTSNINVQNR